MRKLIGAALCAVALSATDAAAHEGGTHARGVVKEITKERIVLMTPEGKPLTIALGAGTRIVRGSRTIPVEGVQLGERAVVHATSSNGHLEATEVKLGSAPTEPRKG